MSFKRIPSLRDSDAVNTSTARTRKLEELAQRYYSPLLSFFNKRSRNGSDVPDLVQQVFLQLAQSRELHRVHNPDGYIFQTAANILRDYQRRQAVRDHNADRSGGLCTSDDTDFSAERVLLSRESIVRLAHALRQLPERTRDIVMLRCFEGLKLADIASLHGISVRAVEKHIAKALSHLSAVLKVGENF